MSNYIDFEIAREYLHKACECLGGNGGLMLKIKFDEEPKADVQEVVHGEWVVKGQEVYCSKCKKTSGYNWHGASAFSKFCPSCGAMMEGGRRYG